MSILSQIGTKVGSEIKNLDIRLSSAETAIVNLGGQEPPPTGNFTIEPVQWTNLTEINLSGEKLQNISFDPPPLGLGVEVEVLATWNNGGKTAQVGEIYTIDLVQENGGMRLTNSTQSIFASPDQLANQVQALHPTNGVYKWSVQSGTIDQAKLKEGIIKGSGGAVAVKQTFSQTIPTGTELVFKATRADTQIGNIRFNPIRASDGVVMSANIGIDPSIGFETYTTTIAISGVKLDTLHGLREIDSVSVFQGVVSGGSVEVSQGAIEKISGSFGYNSGASSVQKIDGQSNGYVQFQIGHADKSVRVGLVEQDVDFEVEAPYKMSFLNGNINLFTPFLENQATYEEGDFFRIRHYASDNTIRFQKRETIYQDDEDFCLLQTCGLQPNNGQIINHTFSEDSRPLIKAIRNTSGGLVKDQYYEIHIVNTETSSSKIYEIDGTFVAWLGGRGSDWEVQESLGEDYVTFHTHSVLTSGNDLYVDTSFQAVGSRINDVQIAYE